MDCKPPKKKNEKLIQDVVNLLDGCEYLTERRSISSLANMMKANDIVAVFGQSDDLMEFAGAISDEVGAWEGETVLINRNIGLVVTPDHCDECDDCEFWNNHLKTQKNAKITAIWATKDENGEVKCSWGYETTIPHHKFRVMDDGELFCEGIVFDLKDI